MNCLNFFDFCGCKNMFKQRLEAVSDGVFAIVMTLLVIEIKVPEIHGSFSEEKLWHRIVQLSPLFFGFLSKFCSFDKFLDNS